MENDDFHHQNVANTMENERFELKTVANTVEMAVSSSKMLQIAWKMHVFNVVSTSVSVCVCVRKWSGFCVRKWSGFFVYRWSGFCVYRWSFSHLKAFFDANCIFLMRVPRWNLGEVHKSPGDLFFWYKSIFILMLMEIFFFDTFFFDPSPLNKGYSWLFSYGECEFDVGIVFLFWLAHERYCRLFLC